MPMMTKAGYTPPKGQMPKRPSPRKRKPAQKKKGRRVNTLTVVSFVIFLLAACVGAGTLYIYSQVAPYRGTFLPGLWAYGYPLVGCSYEEGRALLQRATDEELKVYPFEIEYGGTTYVITREDIDFHVDLDATLEPLWKTSTGNIFLTWMEMMLLQREPHNAEPVCVYDLSGVDDLLALVKADIDRESVDATVTFHPGSSTPFSFTQEQVGLRLDTAPLLEKVEYWAKNAPHVSKITAQPEELLPSVYMDDLMAATVLRARVTLAMQDDEDGFLNAALAARALNGAVIAPGEELSFNETVGARTAARGYVAAAEPAYGAGAEGTGGGVCQTATALYQAALLGGVTVKQRSAAATPVAYAQAGQEAAVSDQGLDLVLKNDGETPLFVTARAYGMESGSPAIEVQIIGAPLEARYALESSVTEIPAPEEPVYVRDSEGRYATYSDERVPVSDAQPGYAALVERVTFDADGNEIERETVGEDEYAALAQAIYVGVQTRE